MLSLSHSEKSIINCDKKFLEFPYVISLHKKIKKLEETKLEMEGKLNIINLKCSDLISKKNVTDFLKNEKNEILIGKDEEIIKLKTKLKKLSTDLENTKITLRNCKEEHSLEWKKMEAENKLALNNLNSEKIKELEKMKLSNEKVLDELKNKKNVELKVNNIENNIKIEKLKISQQEEIENLKIENKKEIEKKDFILKNEINSIISNNEIKLTKLKTENMIEIDRIEKEKRIEIDFLNMEKNAKIFIIEEEQKESIEIIQKEKNNLEALSNDKNLTELSDRLGIPKDEIKIMAQRLSGRDVSLDKPIDDEGSSTLGSFQSSSTESMEDAFAREEMINLLRTKLSELEPGLSEREKIILHERLLNEEPLTLQEIGEKYGITREAVRQMEARLIKKIKDTFGDF